MKQFLSVYPKKNVLPIHFYSLSMSLVLFGISWLDLVFVLLIDTAAFFLVHPIEKYFFFIFYPESRQIFDERELESFEEQNHYFNLLAEFPGRRCLYLFAWSLLKVLPVGLYISSVSSLSNFTGNLGIFYLADAFVLIYFHGLLFIQLHAMASDRMRELLGLKSWVINYRNLRLGHLRDKFSSIQNTLLVSMLTYLLVMTIFLIERTETGVGKLSVLFASSIVCIVVLQLKFQKFLNEALTGLFRFFKEDLIEGRPGILPYHTSPVLAGFEFTVNQLGQQLEEREKEIALWLKHETEKFHLRSLGEVAAMVAHDIKTPLGIMRASLDMINDPCASEELKQKYMAILEKNLEQTLSFTQTLMSYLRGRNKDGLCVFGEVHDELISLFQSHFSANNFERVRFQLSPELRSLVLRLDRMDAMHVFYNLYQNALKVILKEQSPGSMVLWSEKGHNGEVSIYLKNSGDSLSEEDFLGLISFDRLKTKDHFYQGLGLRVTHSILTLLKGKLQYVPVDEGTCLKVILPMAEDANLVLDERAPQVEANVVADLSVRHTSLQDFGSDLLM